METCYVICSPTGTPVYFVAPDTWTADYTRAQRFQFRSMAEAYALGELDLDPNQYVIELVSVPTPEDAADEFTRRVTRAARTTPRLR